MSTPAIVADSSAAGLTAQLAEVWASLRELGASLDDSDWAHGTPCPGWPVSAQFAHVVGTESMLLGRPTPEVEAGTPEHVRNPVGGGNEIWIVALAGRARAEVLDLLAEVTEARLEALGRMSEEDFAKESWTPVGRGDYRRFMQIRVFDCWVHEQDVRDAVGRPGHETGAVAEQSVDEVVRVAGYLVGKRAAAPSGSSVRIELTGPVTRRIDVSVADGRARVVEALDGTPTATVRLGSNAFTRLACGRVDPADVAAGAVGGYTVAGDEALGRRVAENLAFTI